VLRRRLARMEWDSKGVQPLDSAAGLRFVTGVLGEDSARRRTPSARNSIRRRVISSLLALLLAGPVFLVALPLLTYTQQMIAGYYSDRAGESCQVGDFARCVVYWQRSIRMAPATASSYYELGRAYEGSGADEAALTSYEQAINMNPQLYDAYLAMAEIFIAKRQDYHAASSVIESAFRQHPGQTRVQAALYTNLSRTNIGLANWDQAHRNLGQAIQIDPTRGAPHCLLAEVLEAESKADWAMSEWGLCAAMSNQIEVEAPWRVAAARRLDGFHP